MTATLVTLSLLLAASFFFIYLRKKNQYQQLSTQQTALSASLLQLQATEKQWRDEAERLASQQQRSEKDVVTGLYAWHLFEDRVKQSVIESERYGLTMGIMIIDLDNFKMINEALGYQVGNRLLNEMGQRLTSCLRQLDSVTREGKDKFVVLLKQLSKAETAVLVATRMLEAIIEPFKIGEHELYVTACIGIALYPADGAEADILFRHADQALHLAKQQGKHLFQFYQSSTHSQSQRELAINTQLYKETILSELQLCYQPIINIETKEIVCMEAQLFWHSDDYGLIMSDELFSYAENQRKLAMVSEWLIKSACMQFLQWENLGIKFVLLGLPLSIKQLESSQFMYQLAQLLQTLPFNPQSLLIEIKEDLTLIPFSSLEKALNQFNYLGIKTAIADFDGSAFPLQYLKNLDVNYLKLDKAFVSDLVENPKARQLLKSLLMLAKNVSIQLVVQGVESEEQMTILRELGCVLVQGNLLGAPLSSYEVQNTMMPTTEKL